MKTVQSSEHFAVTSSMARLAKFSNLWQYMETPDLPTPLILNTVVLQHFCPFGGRLFEFLDGFMDRCDVEGLGKRREHNM
jgi:hypothetical protein